jgi:hypothetical protein
MKISNVKAMGFGFSAINAGQRNAVVEPQIIAVSTEGNFRITPPVSRALGIGHGDYIMFVTNVENIDEAIRNKAPEVIAFCEENGLEVGSAEAAIALHKEFDMYAIAKGIAEYDPKGNMKTTTERLTKNDKIKFVSQRFDEMLAAALEQADEQTKVALTRKDVTKEEQIDILSAFVTPRELTKFKGSKVANPAGLTGAGTSLTFTDSNVWKQLKADMGDDAEKLNRVYDADVENLQDIVINDGYKNVTVKAIILGEYTDKEPVRINKGGNAKAGEIEE